MNELTTVIMLSITLFTIAIGVLLFYVNHINYTTEQTIRKMCHDNNEYWHLRNREHLKRAITEEKERIQLFDTCVKLEERINKFEVGSI